MRIASLLLVSAVLLASSSARADRRACEVVFVRAPDAVRLVIESWLRAEPRCAGTIELRVVETETGTLYLIAQRPDGRIHEREVPDAQSAGVLVASWIADDWTSAPAAKTEDAPPEAPAPLTVNPFAGAPGLTDVIVAPAPAPAPRPSTTGRWFTLGTMIAMNGEGGAGIRSELELLGGTGSPWTLGVVAAGSSSQHDMVRAGAAGYMTTVDLKLLAQVARTVRLGERWAIRGAVALGVVYSSAESHVQTSLLEDLDTAEAVDSTLEASLLLSRTLGRGTWALTVGPVATIYEQDLDSTTGGAGMRRHETQLMFLAGARYRL